MEISVNPERSEWSALLRRPQIARSVIGERVAAILESVRTEGDRALLQLTREIDKTELTSVIVTRDEIEEAASLIPDDLKEAIETAAQNIERFHAAQKPQPVDMETMPGVRCVQRAVPIQRVGLYVPGGSAPLFSTVLMLAVPAQVAGCREIILCTPPDKQGKIAPAILYAASQAGVNRIFKVNKEYEEFIDMHDRTNGEIDVAINIIKEAHEKRTREHSFVEDAQGYEN